MTARQTQREDHKSAKLPRTSQCLTFVWLKFEINRKNNFQGKRQSTVSAAHPGMGQIPTVRWTQQHFENNHDDDDDDDDDDKNDDDGLPWHILPMIK